MDTPLPRNPFLAVDCLIEMKLPDGESGFILIERKNPPIGYALPGGFVDYGESVEDAVRREMREETGLELTNLEQFHVYSDPKRDPRQHTVSVVFHAEGVGTLKAGDDAKTAKLVSWIELENYNLVFDHSAVLTDFAIYVLARYENEHADK